MRRTDAAPAARLSGTAPAAPPAAPAAPRAVRAPGAALVLAACLAACSPAGAPGPGGAGIGARPLLLVSDRAGPARIFATLPGDAAGRMLAAPEDGGARGAHHDCMPARLPDGRIAFVSDRDGNPEIYLTSADGRQVQRLTRDPPDAPAVDAAPAPLGAGAIVFARGAPGDPDGVPADLYLSFLDGSAPRRLTRHAADDRAPAGSADGRTILFVSDRDGRPGVYRLTDPGTGDAEERVELLVAEAGDPVLLPDGSFVVARLAPEGVPHLYHAHAPGARGAVAGWRQITDSVTLPFGAFEPVILPDSGVLFTTGPAGAPRGAERPGRFAVYRVALGGFNLSRVTRDGAGYNDFSRGLQACR